MNSTWWALDDCELLLQSTPDGSVLARVQLMPSTRDVVVLPLQEPAGRCWDRDGAEAKDHLSTTHWGEVGKLKSRPTLEERVLVRPVRPVRWVRPVRLVVGLRDGPSQGNADDQWRCLFQSPHSFFLAAGDEKGCHKVNRILLGRGPCLPRSPRRLDLSPGTFSLASGDRNHSQVRKLLRYHFHSEPSTRSQHLFWNLLHGHVVDEEMYLPGNLLSIIHTLLLPVTS